MEGLLCRGEIRTQSMEARMAATLRKILPVVCATQLILAGCATPHRLPAVPQTQVMQTGEALGSVRFLVSRETETFTAEAYRSLAKEQAWLASQGRGPDLPPAYFLAVSGGGDNGAY